MTPKWKHTILSGLIAFSFVFLCGCGSDRVAKRGPGASTEFPNTTTGYKAKKNYLFTVVVTLPVDRRAEYAKQHVGGTKWKGCSKDDASSTHAAQLIQDRLVKELRASGLFMNVTTVPISPSNTVIKTEIQAFCSKSKGFLFTRIGGVSALRIKLDRTGKNLLDQTFGKVVTTSSQEYTGGEGLSAEQQMNIVMADSLHEVMKELFARLEKEAASWPPEAPAPM